MSAEITIKKRYLEKKEYLLERFKWRVPQEEKNLLKKKNILFTEWDVHGILSSGHFDPQKNKYSHEYSYISLSYNWSEITGNTLVYF